MAEPISLAASIIGIADVCFRLVSYLRDAKASAKTIQTDIDALISEVQTLMQLHGDAAEVFRRHSQTGSVTSTYERVLWHHTLKALDAGQDFARRLEECARGIFGKNPKVRRKRDASIKQDRKRQRLARLSELRSQT